MPRARSPADWVAIFLLSGKVYSFLFQKGGVHIFCRTSVEADTFENANCTTKGINEIRKQQLENEMSTSALSDGRTGEA